MIILVEMQCKEWEHNRVNAGIVDLFYKAFPKEEIRLYAEKNHIAGVKELIADKGIITNYTSIEFYDWRVGSEKNVDKYEQLMLQIIDSETDVKKIIFLSCNKGIIMAANRLSRRVPEVEVYLILHAALEEVCKKDSLQKKLRDLYNEILGREKDIILRDCINSCEALNCRFVLYSPCYEKQLKGKVKRKILNKFIFLHHPFYQDFSEIKERVDNKIVIGLYGQAVNENAYAVIATYNKKYDNGRVLFRVMAKDDNPIWECKNVERVLNKDFVTNAELEVTIQNFDYILIPYANNQYRVTASGIFWDAVSQEVPILMLDSPILKYYSKYQVGVIKNDIDSLAACLGQLEFKENTVFGENERKLKQISLKENIYILREKMK